MSVIQYRSLNENNRYVGESHPKSKLSDAEVDRLRDMHEKLGLSVRFICRATGIPRRTLRSILSYKTRAHQPVRVVKYVRPNNGRR